MDFDIERVLQLLDPDFDLLRDFDFVDFETVSMELDFERVFPLLEGRLLLGLREIII
jgi:superfamily II helicase